MPSLFRKKSKSLGRSSLPPAPPSEQAFAIQRDYYYNHLSDIASIPEEDSPGQPLGSSKASILGSSGPLTPRWNDTPTPRSSEASTLRSGGTPTRNSGGTPTRNSNGTPTLNASEEKPKSKVTTAPSPEPNRLSRPAAGKKRTGSGTLESNIPAKPVTPEAPNIQVPQVDATQPYQKDAGREKEGRKQKEEEPQIQRQREQEERHEEVERCEREEHVAIKPSFTAVCKDWSGRGSHVDFSQDETPPLQEGRFLGHGTGGWVHETVISGYSFAWKRSSYKRRIGQAERNEIEILKKLSHAHIVQLIGTYTHRQLLGLLLYPVAVCDLAAFFEDYEAGHPEVNQEPNRADRFRKLGLSYGTIEDYHRSGRTFLKANIGCMISAVAYLHEQKIHYKDLKPSNILISQDCLWLTDFGISRDFSSLSKSETVNRGGTARYLAPEIPAFEPSGRSADIFALGCVLLEMCVIISHGSRKPLKPLCPLQDGSYQANLASTERWLGLLKVDWSSATHHLLTEIRRMLARDPELRPTAPELRRNLAFIDITGQGNIKGLFYRDCCRAVFIPEEEHRQKTDALKEHHYRVEAALEERIVRLMEEHQSVRTREKAQFDRYIGDLRDDYERREHERKLHCEGQEAKAREELAQQMHSKSQEMENLANEYESVQRQQEALYNKTIEDLGNEYKRREVGWKAYYNKEVGKVREQLQQSETQHKAQRDSDAAVHVAQMQEVSDQLKSTHGREKSKLQEQVQRKSQKVEELEAERRKLSLNLESTKHELNVISEQLGAYKSENEKLDQQSRDERDALQKHHNNVIGNLRQSHVQEIELQREEHERSIERMKEINTQNRKDTQKHADDIALLRTEKRKHEKRWIEEEQELKGHLVSLERYYEDREYKLRRDMDTLKAQHAGELAEMKSEHVQKIDYHEGMHAALMNEHRTELERQKKDHAQEMVEFEHELINWRNRELEQQKRQHVADIQGLQEELGRLKKEMESGKQRPTSPTNGSPSPGTSSARKVKAQVDAIDAAMASVP